jgi:hypothetical protein
MARSNSANALTIRIIMRSAGVVVSNRLGRAVKSRFRFGKSFPGSTRTPTANFSASFGS